MQSIDEYKNTLSARMQCEKDDSEIEAEGVDEVNCRFVYETRTHGLMGGARKYILPLPIK